MKTLLVAALLALAIGGPAPAGPASDALFAEGIFDALPDGQTIVYSHIRTGTTAENFAPLADGRISIVIGPALEGARNLSMTLEEQGKRRELVDFPSSGGNPVLMVFLESTVRSMATIAGGSPFYIRNRIKDALRSDGVLTMTSHDFGGKMIAAQEVTFHPFAQDPNRARMGEFADLSLRFLVSDAVPGQFLLLSADTPVAAAGYHESITLTPEEVAK